jgi:pimeloyl-ACP methyl ester carboxylesterase
MPKLNLGTFELWHEESGASGEPVVLIHGAWGDHHQFDAVAARLAGTCRVLTYDRRGHGASSSPAGSVALADQVGDLSTLLSMAGRGAHHIVGNGVGGVIALQLALLRPDQVRSVNVHEPNLIGLLSADAAASPMYAEARGLESVVLERLRTGDSRGAAQTFVDGVSADPGGWSGLPPAIQASFVSNAKASLSEETDPTTQTMEIAKFAGYRDPIVITAGSRSSAVFGTINDRLADAFYAPMRYSFEGAGHFPHVSHPDQSVQVITEFCRYAVERTA